MLEFPDSRKVNAMIPIYKFDDPGFDAALKKIVNRGEQAPAGVEETVRDIIAAVRDGVGPNVDLLIEGHSRFTVATALTIARRLEPFHVGWFWETL